MHVAHRLVKLIGWGALLVGLAALVGCRQIAVPLRLLAVESPPGAPPGSPPGVATGSGVSSESSALGAHRTVGQPVVSGNLAVFPIYARKQPDLGRFTTLTEALRAGTAVVRELRANRQVQHQNPKSRQRPVRQQLNLDNRDAFNVANNNENDNIRGGSARVNRLVIDNQGELPILVLAGTVVKGGKQDRQIGQDFVVGAKKQVAVQTFCVEQGRWNANRAGKATGGRFTAVDSLANLAVRNAAQHDSNQSLVWQKVASTNADNNVKSGSGTLMATLDHRELRRARQQLLNQMNARLKALPRRQQIVGLAYAVHGRVRSVRWFFNRAVFLKFQKALLITAALESQTAQARARRLPAPAKQSARATVRQVVEFIASFDQPTRRHRRETAGMNDNYYRGNDKGNQSTTVLRTKGVANPISVDFSAK